MRISIPSVLAALALASCQPMQQQGDKSVDPAARPAGTQEAKNAEAAAPRPADPHADPHAGLQNAPATGSPGMGFMPNYDAGEAGVGVSSVRPGGPAEKAGLKAGDVIVKFAGIPVGDVHEYMAALETVDVGDEIDIVVKRGTETVTLKGKVGVSNR